MRNDIAEYERAGKLASQATIHGDSATAQSWSQWARDAIAFEKRFSAEDAIKARQAFDAAYKSTRELDQRWRNLSRRD